MIQLTSAELMALPRKNRIRLEGLSGDGSLKPDCLNMLSLLGLDGYACVEEVARFVYEADSRD